MRAKYGSPDQFFAYRSKQYDSWVQKCLLQVRPFIKHRIRWKVGNGSSIKLWTDSWCSEDSLVSKLDLDHANLPNANIKLNEFITLEKQWDTTKLRSCLPNDPVQLM